MAQGHQLMFGQHISTLYRCIMKINITIAIVTWVCLVLLVQRVRQLAFRFKNRQSVDDLCFVRGQVLNGLAFKAGLDHHHVLVEQHFAVFIIKRLHLLRYNRQPMVSDSATTPWGSDILVLKIILVLVFIQFWVNNFYFSFSFSFEIILVSISVLVSVLK